LKADKCLSKYEIRTESLLGGVYFGFSLVFRLYTAHLFCSSSFIGLCSPYAETRFFNNIIFVIREKNNEPDHQYFIL
jgi:hypothetical protein